MLWERIPVAARRKGKNKKISNKPSVARAGASACFTARTWVLLVLSWIRHRISALFLSRFSVFFCRRDRTDKINLSNSSSRSHTSLTKSGQGFAYAGDRHTQFGSLSDAILRVLSRSPPYYSFHVRPAFPFSALWSTDHDDILSGYNTQRDSRGIRYQRDLNM